MKRVPLLAVQRAVYERLSKHQTAKIYDAVPDNQNLRYNLPFITFGNFTYSPNGTKVNDVSRVTLNLDIWSSEDGRSEVQEIANDLIFLIEYGAFPLDDDFVILKQEIEMFESFSEDGMGYHGVLTIAFEIQNLKGE